MKTGPKPKPWLVPMLHHAALGSPCWAAGAPYVKLLESCSYEKA